ncbi:MAG: hypothetical protein ACO3N7_11195 [Kiritimatiellia bacterium]
MKKVNRILFLGNGVNQVGEGDGWGDLLRRLDQGQSGIFTVENQDPFPIQYQQYLADRLNHGHDNDSLYRTQIAHQFKMMSREMKDRSAHKAVLGLGYRCILTTNYDHGLQKAWIEDSEGMPDPGPLERKFNLFRRYLLDGA